MLHRCESCHQLYLTSEFHFLCNYCGEQRQRQIEHLLDDHDGAVEWWQVAVVIASGEQVRRQPRWEIR